MEITFLSFYFCLLSLCQCFTSFFNLNPKSLLEATCVNDLEMIEMFLCGMKGEIDVNEKGSEGMTSLHFAVLYNLTEVVQMLLSNGRYIIEVNARDDFGWTPLHYAVFVIGKEEIVQLLLDMDDIDLNVKQDKQWSPLHFAIRYNTINVVKMLLSKGRNIIDFNARDDFGWTLLHHAAAYGTVEMLHLLLGVAEIEGKAKTAEGFTACDLAFKYRDSEFHNLFRKQYADQHPYHQHKDYHSTRLEIFCPVCQDETLTDPIAFECGHISCSDCFSLLLPSLVSDCGYFPCPVCRMNCSLCHNKVLLPKNRADWQVSCQLCFQEPTNLALDDTGEITGCYKCILNSTGNAVLLWL